MQYSIPQFIDTEDRIIGPLTLKQFLWLLGGGGVLTAVWMATGNNVAIFIVTALPVGAFFFGMAFVKIAGRPLLVFLINMLMYIIKPQLYLWKRSYEKHHESKVAVQKNIKKDESAKKDFSQSKIAELAWVLDTGGNTSLDIKDKKYGGQ